MSRLKGLRLSAVCSVSDLFIIIFHSQTKVSEIPFCKTFFLQQVVVFLSALVCIRLFQTIQVSIGLELVLCVCVRACVRACVCVLHIVMLEPLLMCALCVSFR